MNSSEQKDFEHITPTADDISETVDQLRAKLGSEALQNPERAHERQGYELAIAVLTEQSTDYTDIPRRAGSERAKAIAVLAINYLTGECSRQVLLNNPAFNS